MRRPPKSCSTQTTKIHFKMNPKHYHQTFEKAYKADEILPNRGGSTTRENTNQAETQTTHSSASTTHKKRTLRSALLPLVIVSLALSGQRLKAQDVDDFYNYIVNTATLDGVNTSSLPSNPDEAYKTAFAAYVWGLPLEETWRTQIVLTNGDNLPVNSLVASQNINSSTTVVAPSTDLLYTSGFLNLTGNTAYVLGVPAASASGPYNVVAFLDAYTNVNHSVGTRNFANNSIDNTGGNYLVVGPQYDTSQPLPAGIKGYIQSDTVQNWVIGRVAVDPYATGTLSNGQPTPYNELVGGASDPLSLNNSRAFEDSYTFTPLSTYLSGSQTPITPSTSLTPPTISQLQTAGANTTVKTGQSFFQYVGNSVVQNGVPSSTSNNQQALFQNFASIGLTSSGYTAPTDSGTLADINAASTAALNIITGIAASGTGWQLNTTNGQNGATYKGWLSNAVTAKGLLGANIAPEALYPSTTTDSNGLQLNGSKSYEITFPAGSLPPVNSTLGWWSLTVYNSQGFVVPNTGNTFYGANEYSLGSNQLENVLGSAYGNGAITLYLSSQAPSDPSLLPYWLPVPDSNFEVALRNYLPDGTEDSSSLLNDTYAVPEIVQIPEPASSAFIGLGLLVLLATWRRRNKTV